MTKRTLVQTGSEKIMFDTEKKTGIFLFYILLAVFTVSFIAKVYLVDGMLAFIDEASMFATSYRFYQGDAILVDDWSAPQLFGVALLPLFSIFRVFSDSNEGLYLFMRLNYVGLKLAILIYGIIKAKHMRLNRFYVYSGLFLWYIFSTSNMETLTYQSMPLVLLMFVYIGALADNSTKLEYFLMGLAYALSVLSQVFFILSYPIILIILIVRRKKTGKSNRSAVFFHLGILSVFLGFLYLLFSRASLHDIIVNLPYVFSEPDHDISGMNAIVSLLRKCVITFGNLMLYRGRVMVCVNVLLLLILSIAFITKWGHRMRLRTLIPVSLLISILGVAIEKCEPYMNMIFTPFIWASIEALFFIQDRRYLAYWIMSYMYTAAVAFGTNTGHSATSGTLILAAVIFIFFWAGVDEGLRNKDDAGNEQINRITKFLPHAAFFTAITCAILLSLVYKFSFTPWSNPHEPYRNFINRIMAGPMKGLYTTNGLYEIYMDTWNDIERIEKTEDTLLFCGTGNSMAFLDAEMRYGTMSTMFFYLDFDRVANYWRLHPDRIPTIIYFDYYSDDDVNSLMSILPAENYEIHRDGLKLFAIQKQTQ